MSDKGDKTGEGEIKGWKVKKEILAGILFTAVAAGFAFLMLSKDNKPEETTPSSEITASSPVASPKVSEPVKQSNIQPVQKETIKKTDLFTSVPDSQLPLSAITQLTDLPENINNKVREILDSSNNIYFIKRNGDKVVIAVDNPSDNRFGVEIIEYSLQDISNGKNILLYLGSDEESEHDIWEYEPGQSEARRPVKHTKYDSESNIEYTEKWCYSDDEPVKYEIKDADDKTISIKKETVDNDTNLRQELIFYDKNGETKINVSVSYDGPDITRFTYYNADKPEDSASIFSEYTDGVKTKEVLYTSDFKVLNTYKAGYTNGARTDITVFDANNNEVEKLLSK